MQSALSIGNYRWRICALVFFATTINYLDRQVISLLKDDYLSPLFNWSENDYANIVIAFQVSYAVGMLGAGWFIDRLGTKSGYSLFITVWSVAAVLHGFVRSTAGFAAVRALLGLSEAGNFPAAVKTIAEWFPKKERALATGIFNSGTNVGAIIAPLSVPFIAVAFGWQWAFIITGAIGFFWLIFWFAYYDSPSRHAKLSREEAQYISQDANEESATASIPWWRLFSFRQTWAVIAAKFFTDPVWWFYLFWLPSFLNAEYGLKKTQLGLPLAIVYCMTTVGSIFGGWLSGYYISKGWPTHKARKTTMLLLAFCVLPVFMTQMLSEGNPWIAVLIIGLAASAHQGWSANAYTLASDMFPKKAVGSVVGIAGMAGAVGGILIAKAAGLLLDHYKALNTIETGYYIMFFICGSAYLVAWACVHFLAPKMDKVDI